MSSGPVLTCGPSWRLASPSNLRRRKLKGSNSLDAVPPSTVRAGARPFRGRYLGLDPDPVRKEIDGKQLPFYRVRLVKERGQAVPISERYQHSIKYIGR